jgi:hypothetical protein
MSSMPIMHLEPGKPTGDVVKVMAIWRPSVISTPDPLHGGEPLLGIAGRVYMFGPDISVPLVGDGPILAELYSDMPGAKKEPLEGWHFDKDSLKLLLKKDAAGWGYTLFLPWGTYKPDITRVHIRLRYEKPGALPIYANSDSMTLQKPGDGIVKTTTSQKLIMPAGAKPQG